MVRRRMAAPKPSPPVRSVSRQQASSGSYAAPQSTATHSTPMGGSVYGAPRPAGMTMAAPTESRGPSLMGQMAATAGGVAIGSAVVIFEIVHFEVV